MKVLKKELLSPSEKQLASEFVASEFWPIYKKIVMNAYENVKEVNLGSATWDECNYNRGRAYQIKWELNQFRGINKQVQAEKAKKKAKGAKNAVQK